MAFDSLGRYVPNHKSWDHVGNMIPVVEASEGDRPHGEFKPAAWLPVQLLDKYYEVWFVVLPGKILAMDNDGRLCPAGYGAGTPLDITYTTNDVEAGVIDVRTGTPVTAPATVAVSAVANFMGRTGEAMVVSPPVGVAPYAYFQWAGDGSEFDDGFNPSGLRQHNHTLQHQVAILCDYVLELPLIPAVAAAEGLVEDTNAANVSTLDPLANLPVATNTVRTPITFANSTQTDAATRFVVQVPSVADVLAPGDWHIDYETGVISVYATATLGLTPYDITYSHYASAPTTVSRFASAVGDLQPGDLVGPDANSNWAAAASDDFTNVMGQVLEVENVLGKDALDKVRTAFTSIGTDSTGALPGYAGQMDQMPGSAAGGATDKVHYAGAADLVVRINMISR